jgi:hypothetical protein
MRCLGDLLLKAAYYGGVYSARFISSTGVVDKSVNSHWQMMLSHETVTVFSTLLNF